MKRTVLNVKNRTRSGLELYVRKGVYCEDLYRLRLSRYIRVPGKCGWPEIQGVGGVGRTYSLVDGVSLSEGGEGAKSATRSDFFCDEQALNNLPFAAVDSESLVLRRGR